MTAPAIILVEPQMGENIGAAARACANFGLCDLRLVHPRDGWPNAQAVAMAAGALPDFVEVSVFADLESAVEDIQYLLATTVRTRDMVKPVYAPEAAMSNIYERAQQNIKCGLLFGRERNGLENDEVAKAHGIITVPTNEQFPSLNLSQSVLLLGYEFVKQRVLCSVSCDQPMDYPDKPGNDENKKLAPQKELQQFLDRLESELESGGFFRSDGLKPTMIRNITNIFTRAELTEQEVRTLQGILTTLKKSSV